MLRIFFAGLLSFVFIVLVVPATLLLGFYFALVDGEFYVSDQFVDSAYVVMAAEVADSMKGEHLPVIKREDLQGFFEKVIFKDDLRAVIGDIFSQVKNASVNEEGKIHISLGLNWLMSKNELIVNEASNFVAGELPECETAAMPGELQCVPKGMARADFRAMLEGKFRNEFMKNMPKELAFDVDVSKKLAGHSVADFLNRVVKLFFTAVSIALLLVLFLLGLVVFKPWQAILAWEVKTLAVAAFALSVLTSVAKFFVPYFLPKFPGVEKLGILLGLNVADKIWLPAMLVFVTAVLLWIFAHYRLRGVKLHGTGKS